MTDDTNQAQIDPFRELTNYDERDEEWPSSAVYETPRRTLANGWRKFHATNDCGKSTVAYLEERTTRPIGPKYEYKLYCPSCGHRVDETDVLFIGGQWWSDHGWKHYGRPLEDLRIPPERVLELGPTPTEDELIDALELGRIEREAAIPHMFSFGRMDTDACEDCGHEVPIRFDRRCRMCYDGPWSDRLTQTLETFGRSLLERNRSFKHRLPKQLSPTSPGGSAYPGTILWRRHASEGTSKLVEVTQRLEDADSGHMEYVLTDPTHTERWQYHEDDLEACFWDTGLRNEEAKPIVDDRIREVYQRVHDHRFRTVHEAETGEPDGEQCIMCRKRRCSNA